MLLPTSDSPASRAGGARPGTPRSEHGAIIARAAAGDEAARDEAWAGLLPSAERLSYRISAGASQRDDLVQEGLLVFPGVLRTFDESRGVPFAAYAGTAMKRRMNAVAAEDRRRRLTRGSLAAEPAAPEGESPRVSRNSVRRAVGALPELQRDVLTRAFGMGVPVETGKEIAGSLDLSQSRVSQLKGLAVKAVGRTLKKELDDPAGSAPPGTCGRVTSAAV